MINFSTFLLDLRDHPVFSPWGRWRILGFRPRKSTLWTLYKSGHPPSGICANLGTPHFYYLNTSQNVTTCHDVYHKKFVPRMDLNMNLIGLRFCEKIAYIPLQIWVPPLKLFAQI